MKILIVLCFVSVWVDNITAGGHRRRETDGNKEKHEHKPDNTHSWNKQNLSWGFLNPAASGFEFGALHTIFERAFAVWSDNSGLSFRYADINAKDADIRIQFISIDGPMHKVRGNLWKYNHMAKSSWPPVGLIQIDKDEPWTDKAYHGINLERAAACVIGMALGIPTNQEKWSLVYEKPWEHTYAREGLQASATDLAYVQGKYGPPTPDECFAKSTRTDDACNGQISCIDRHSVYCENIRHGQFLKTMNLRYNSTSNQMRYDYTCCTRRDIEGCKQGHLCRAVREVFTDWKDEQTAQTNSLTEHAIDCTLPPYVHHGRQGGRRGFIMDVQMEWKDSDTNNVKPQVRYKYNCCDTPSLRFCSYHVTDTSQSSASGTSQSLSGLNIACPNDKMLSKIQLVQTSSGSWRYEFICCS